LRDLNRCVDAGSLSHPTANKIYIIKRGEKFPPLKYDADLPPAIMVDTDWRRDGDVLGARKQAKVTKVSPIFIPETP
jgi:hypothetical protein